MKLELFRSRCSPYVERVQVALRLKGVTWTEHYVTPFLPATPLDHAGVRAAIRWLDLEVFLAAYALLDEVVAYERRSDAGRRYRFEAGRVFLRPSAELDAPAAERARDRLALSVERFAALVAGLSPEAARSTALVVAFQPLVHNPDFAYFGDPGFPFAGPPPWTGHRALTPLVAAARALPTDHVTWMYA